MAILTIGITFLAIILLAVLLVGQLTRVPKYSQTALFNVEIDRRMIVDSLEDITTNAVETFGKVDDNHCRGFDGMVVYVEKEKHLYHYIGGSDKEGIPIDKIKDIRNWKRLEVYL